MTETLQKRLDDWAVSTFGQKTDLAQAIRGNKEMSELLSAIHGGQISSEKIAEECADVTFFLMQICEYHGFDLITEVENKLVINRARSWDKAEDGSYQHVD